MKVINKIETGKRMRRKREAAYLPGKTVAAMLGKSKDIIFGLENGRFPPNALEVIESYAKAIGADPEELIIYYSDRKEKEKSHPCAYSRRNTNGVLLCNGRIVLGRGIPRCRHPKEAERCAMFMPKPRVTYETRRKDW